MNKIRTGIIAIREAANTSPQFVVWTPWKDAIATGIVQFFGEFVIVAAQTYSSQTPRNEMIAEVARDGLHIGSMI